MHFRPILSSLSRHRTAAALIIVEMAVTCAILCNALFLVGERLERMHRPSGVAESELVRVFVTGDTKTSNHRALQREDLAALSTIPGVHAVAAAAQLPFGGSSRNRGIKLASEALHPALNATVYIGSESLLETLGVRLVAGRYFTPDEYVDDDAGPSNGVIITAAVSERLWPGQSGIGKTLYIHEGPLAVVGIIERLVRPNESSGASNFDLSVVLPVRAGFGGGGNYVLRTDPQRRAEVLRAAVTALERNSRSRVVVDPETLEEIRAGFYQADRAMAWLLVSACAALLVITALGIVGLASFWVQQRTRQIGIRRALGATRRQILRYFQAENFVLATLGSVLGMGMAYGINLLLMEKYAIGRLPAQFLPVGAFSLWLLGQLAVLGPALRAASVPPAVATRTV